MSEPEVTYQVMWTPDAEQMLDEIITYIANDSVKAARDSLQLIKKRAGSLSFSPMRGRYVPELLELGIRTYREIIVKPWRIIYKVGSADIYILLVIDSRRDVASYLSMELTKGRF